MLLFIAIAAGLGAGGFALTRKKTPPKQSGSPPPAAPIPPKAPGLISPRQGTGAPPVDLKIVSSGIGLAGTAGSAGAAALGVSTSVIALWAAAVAAIVGFSLIVGFVAFSAFQAIGREGYRTGFLVTTATKVGASMLQGFISRGCSAFQARACCALYGFYVARGYNRAAIAFVLNGQPLAGFDFSQAEAKGLCLRELAGWFYKPIVKLATLPPGVPRPDDYTEISFEEQALGPGGLAQALDDAKGFWTRDYELAAEFNGRALRCQYEVERPKAVGLGFSLSLDNGALEAGYAVIGAIGGAPAIPGTVHTTGDGRIAGATTDGDELQFIVLADRIVDRAFDPVTGNRGSGLAWFFHGVDKANPVRAAL